MKKFILFITIVASAILANAYDYDSLSDRVDKLKIENRNRAIDTQMISLSSDDYCRQNLPFDPGF